MSDYKCNCSYISIIIGIVIGVIIGILYAFGFVASGTTLLVYLAIGVAGILLTPVYGYLSSLNDTNCCYCGYRNILLAGSVGTVITAAAAIIITRVDSIVAIAVAIAIATFFVVMFLSALVCLARCIGCRK